MADLKHQIQIEAAPEKVFAAIATQAGLRTWWTADSVADERAGGKASFGFGRRATVFRMDIERLDSPARVTWRCTGGHPEWEGTMFHWELAPKGAATTLRFTHGNWKAESEYFAMCNSTWGELMHRLKDSVEGRNPGPHWRE
jgi:uncharacterized protein YndB with AHSA1/START domain